VGQRRSVEARGPTITARRRHRRARCANPDCRFDADGAEGVTGGGDGTQAEQPPGELVDDAAEEPGLRDEWVPALSILPSADAIVGLATEGPGHTALVASSTRQGDRLVLSRRLSALAARAGRTK